MKKTVKTKVQKDEPKPLKWRAYATQIGAEISVRVDPDVRLERMSKQRYPRIIGESKLTPAA